ncbi:MAG: hypothetical protein ACJ75S_07530 [Solirubrobacterales bacterium]
MAAQAVQILSSTKDLGERVFQLAPEPSEQWWRAWDRMLSRWLNEVARLPPDVEISGSLPDEIVASGVTGDNADDLDRALAALVLAVNRELAKPSRD